MKFTISKSRKHKSRVVVTTDAQNFKKLDTFIGCWPFETSRMVIPEKGMILILDHEAKAISDALIKDGWTLEEAV